jgi:sigma54-dependent transcription regulator
MVPLGRAARVLHYHADGDGAMCLACLGNAKAALTAAVEDREGLARVLIRHDSDRMTCFDHDGECCPAEDAHDFESRETHQADAVARWLTGGAV